MKSQFITVGLLWVLAAGAATLGVSGCSGSAVLGGETARRAPDLAAHKAVQLDRASAGDRRLWMGDYLDKAPPRQRTGLRLVKNGWTYNCMECHKLLTAKWHYDRPLNEHQNIHLEHGNNRFCLNCHHSTNRNVFVDYDGAEIAQSDVVQLCAKCHGTIYRDWEAGVHGRENGFWNASFGEKMRLSCIDCHDPHSPRFKAMRPLPPLRYPPRGAHRLVEAKAGHESQSAPP